MEEPRLRFNSFMPLVFYTTPLLTLAEGHRSAKSQTCLVCFLAHFSAHQDGIWCRFEAVQIKRADTTFELFVCLCVCVCVCVCVCMRKREREREREMLSRR